MSDLSLEERFNALASYTKNEIDRLQQEKELTDELLVDLVELLVKSRALPIAELEKIFQNRLKSLTENAHHNSNAFYNATRQLHHIRMAVACGLNEDQTSALKYRDKVFKEFDAFLKRV
ncbi:hypothetical protein [Actinobacillus pleuropneumoniae]|uniref:hypothetical protein n=1 Tax=Actinobacillus pleuropneumoniae TaxID=715 RepID=UPI003B02399B